MSKELICSDCGKYESECRCLDNHVNKCDKEQEMSNRQVDALRVGQRQLQAAYREQVSKVQNPYAFMTGGAIPKWEKEYIGFEEARKELLKYLLD